MAQRRRPIAGQRNNRPIAQRSTDRAAPLTDRRIAQQGICAIGRLRCNSATQSVGVIL